MLPVKKLNAETIKEMRSFGEYLMPFNFPIVSPEDEEDINILKSKEMVVDGYSLIVYYSKADWSVHYLEIVQVTGRYVPFLPFSLVCKIGRKILGDKYLSYVEFIKDERKVYCWTVVLDRENNPTIGPFEEKSFDQIYENLNYKILDIAKVNLY